MFNVLMCVNQPMSLSWRTRKKRKAQHSLDWLFEECKCIRCAFVALLCVRYAAFTRLYRWRSLSGCILNGTASVFLHKWPYLSDHIWDVLTVKIRSHSDLTKSCHLKTGEQPVYKWQQYKKKTFQQCLLHVTWNSSKMLDLFSLQNTFECPALLCIILWFIAVLCFLFEPVPITMIELSRKAWLECIYLTVQSINRDLECMPFPWILWSAC